MTKKKKILKQSVIIISASIALIVLISLVLNAVVVFGTSSNIMDLEDISGSDITCDHIVILGCAVYDGGTPSVMLRHRLDVGAELYFSDTADKIIVSGNSTKEFNNEPEAMKNYLISLGVPESDIIKDDLGFSTYETMERAASVFNVEHCIVVTQRYHLYRAVYIGKTNGMETYGVSASLGKYSDQNYYDLREYFARCKDFFLTLIK